MKLQRLWQHAQCLYTFKPDRVLALGGECGHGSQPHPRSCLQVSASGKVKISFLHGVLLCVSAILQGSPHSQKQLAKAK